MEINFQKELYFLNEENNKNKIGYWKRYYFIIINFLNKMQIPVKFSLWLNK